ncbi:tape measure protein [Cohnella cellulosilytica]
MMDRFTQPLQRVTNQVNTAITALERMRRLIERPARMNLNINTTAINARLASIHVAPINVMVRLNTFQALAQATALRAQIISRIGTITATVNLSSNITSLLSQLIILVRQLNQAIRNMPPSGGGGGGGGSGGGGGGGTWFGGFGGLAAGYLSFAGVGAAMQTSDEYINTKARLDLINDGLQTTDELQSRIFSAAKRARGSYEDMAGVIGRMGTLAGDAFRSNDELIAFSELMQKSFRVGGSGTMEQQAGMYQLSQAMAAGKLQGDEFRSIMENAPMLAQAIAKFTEKSKGELKQMSAEGTITADIIKGAMFAAADDINSKFATMPRTFGDIWNEVKNSALQSFGPLIETINQSMQSENFDRLLNGLTIGLQMLASGASWAFSFILNHLDLIRNFLVALGIVALAFAAQWLVSWVIAAWPVLAVIAGIMLLLWLLSKMGVTADQIVGFVAGLFMGLYAAVYNGIASLYNRFAVFAEFFANVFNHPVYSAKKLFVDFVNTTLDSVKKVAEAIDWVFGSDLAGHITSLQNQMQDWLGEMPEGYKVIQRMEEKSIIDEAKKGYDAGSNFMKGISEKMGSLGKGLLGGMDMSGFGGAPNIEKVGEVGKIKDTVDISSEDLKMMRELAEMKSIQNFVTLTPQVSFGDTHVRQDGRSVDEIIANIGDQMTELIASGARGVYT